MGSRVKLVNTSGKRITKKAKINESGLSVVDESLLINDSPLPGGSGEPSAPINSIQYNIDGTFTGDSGFTRTSSHTTFITKAVGSKAYGFALSESVSGSPQVQIIGVDTSANTQASVGVLDLSDQGGEPESPVMSYIADTNDPSNSRASVILGNDGTGNSIFALSTENGQSGTHFFSNNSGNEITWSKDISTGITNSIVQGENVLELGIDGTALFWSNEDSGVVSLVAIGDATGQGGFPGDITIGTISGDNRANIGASYDTSSDTFKSYIGIAYDGVESLMLMNKGATQLTYISGTNISSFVGDVDRAVLGHSENGGVTGMFISISKDSFSIISGGTPMFKFDFLTQLITMFGVPEYTDDAAAVSDGLEPGQVYKTTDGGSTFLKIVP